MCSDFGSIIAYWYSAVAKSVMTPPILKNKLTKPKSIDEIDNCIARLTQIFKEFKDSIPNLDERESLKQKIPPEQYEFLVKEQGTHRRFEWFINKFEKKFNLLNKQLIFLTEKAGQGKTNLICDFVDKVMIEKNLLGVMFCLFFL